MKAWIIFLILIGSIIAYWIGWSYYQLRETEKPQYTVIKKTDAYEIRKYEPYIVAATSESGDFKEAQNKAFKILAGYIFGKNTDNVSMPMTAPVFMKKNDQVDQVYEMQFFMPSKYSLESLPKPIDTSVSILKQEGKVFAAMPFTGYYTQKTLHNKIKTLQELLDKEGISYQGNQIIAQYNAPFAFPLFLKNEILIELIDTH